MEVKACGFVVAMVGLVVSVAGSRHPSTPGEPHQLRDGSCPDPSVILPCLCLSDTSMRLTMECSNVRDEEELARVFTANFPVTDFYELTIYGNSGQNLTSIGELTLRQVTFVRVVIRGTQLSTVDGYAFANSKSTLQLLDLAANRLTTFPFHSLWLYTSLTTFNINANQLVLLPRITSESLQILSVSGNSPLQIYTDAFSETPSLQTIDLTDTGVKTLQPELFTELKQLSTLVLTYNDLERLEQSSVVTGASSLQRLDLSYNKISFVRHDAIMGLSGDALVTFEGNQIEALTQESWRHIFDQLGTDKGIIDLKGNPLLCGCDLAWIILDDRYRSLLTDTTTCVSGEQVIFLDPNIYALMCRLY